jgi:ABC-2 type transport system ATP-binding protein
MGAMSELLRDLGRSGATVLFSSHQLDLVEDLCEDVVIIEHGRIVLAGELEELRAAVPERFADIRFRGAAPDWSRLGPVAVIEASDGQARLRVGCDTDAAAVLTAMGHDVEIMSFTYQPPTLSELFRQAVAA